MTRISVVDGAYASFDAAVPANLLGKEGYAVEQVGGARTVQLYTGNAPLLGWLYQKLEGDVAWTVRLAGKGGTVRCVAGGAIAAPPAYVKASAGGTMVLANSADKAHGVKVDPTGVSAANDFIEVHDAFQVVP
ncbi:MAG TPA: hypothetical protein VHB20_14640 [Verrucomicrobiae bacterium]|jgi:hypothetical protein|nr:hypothetical protein [Verrucomicrobiae bacterium]